MKNKQAFTLIELLVVIAIISLLASIILVAINGARAKARDAKRLADVHQFAIAMEAYFNDFSSYPTTPAGTGSGPGVLTSGSPCLSGLFGCTSYVVPNYMTKLPVAPTPADSASCNASLGAATYNDYQYYGTNGASMVNGYTLSFCLGAATGGIPAGPHFLTPNGIN